MKTDIGEVTQLLASWRDGDSDAFDRLLPLVYDELHRSAAAYLRRERSDHTLQATALVHEAYLRLANVEELDAHDRFHFYAVAARAMRRILVDHARSQQREKRVGAHRRLPLEEAACVPQGHSPDQVIAVHGALQELANSHPRQARLVELRFFGGFSEDEAAEILGVSRATLTRDWRFARVWLYRHLAQDPG
jgi:RNA polymerase sigma factor (TIGR02999 family)